MSASQVEEEVTLHTQPSKNGKLSIITLARPRKYNALSGAHYRRLSDLMGQINADDENAATLIIGTGTFFSAGADVRAVSRPEADSAGGGGGGGTTTESVPSSGDDTAIRRFFTTQFTTGNLNMTHEFLSHRHPLFVGLNGPVIGMTAALVAFADFVYAVEGETYLLTPFASLGLAPEGASSVMFPLKMGHGLAARALLMSERITCKELERSGFVSRVFPREGFAAAVVRQMEAVMEDKNVASMRIAKWHMVNNYRDRVEAANVKEVYGAVDRFSQGIPQQQFLRLANKEKKHKL